MRIKSFSEREINFPLKRKCVKFLPLRVFKVSETFNISGGRPMSTSPVGKSQINQIFMDLF